MAYRFRLDEPIQKEFRRIGAEQIERARRQLAANADPATEVHNSRKCIKRVRALLRLGREGLGEAVFRAENARFRAIAAILAPARDNHVLVEAVTKLEADVDCDATRSGLGSLKALLVKEPTTEQSGHARAGMIEEALTALDLAQRRFRRLNLAPDEVSILTAGLTRSYRRGIKSLDAAYADQGDEAFHQWRKSVQAHWRHMQLLQRTWPALIEARVAAARELSQILGEDHDLALVRQRLESLAPGTLDLEATDRIGSMIAKRQQTLRAAAEPRGRMIYAEHPKAHGQWAAAVWEAAVARDRTETSQVEPLTSKPDKIRAKTSSSAAAES